MSEKDNNPYLPGFGNAYRSPEKRYKSKGYNCVHSLNGFCDLFKFIKTNKFIPCKSRGGCSPSLMREEIYNVRFFSNESDRRNNT